MYKVAENLQEPTSAEQEATHADLLCDGVENTPTEGIAAPTHHGYAPTNNADGVVLESLIHGIPGQASPDYGSARYRIIRHLRELAGVDMNSLRRREPGNRSVTTALHLKHRGVVLGIWLWFHQKAAVTYSKWGFRGANHFKLVSRGNVS